MTDHDVARYLAAIAATLRRYRQARPIADLAARARIKRGHWALFEDGAIVPNIVEIWLIADALGIACADLVAAIEQAYVEATP